MNGPRSGRCSRAYRREITPQSSVVHDPTYAARYFDARFARDADRGQWWATLGDSIVGFANVERGENEAGETFGDVKDFYVVPQWRRRGYGEEFARLLIQQVKARGAVRVTLRARLDSPAAVAFWRHLGFDPILYIMIKELE